MDMSGRRSSPPSGTTSSIPRCCSSALSEARPRRNTLDHTHLYLARLIAGAEVFMAQVRMLPAFAFLCALLLMDAMRRSAQRNANAGSMRTWAMNTSAPAMSLAKYKCVWSKVFRRGRASLKADEQHRGMLEVVPDGGDERRPDMSIHHAVVERAREVHHVPDDD